ncbi:hypothetical protein [Desulfovibrio sp. An276]|uniref:hypothetical protein n=1 Tax=Desulfovibrio sp. An276 TaxID=1965618 RepID=UPI0013A63C08|nr:hypothetical protein [Desulfovibrio sp. An276]
MVFHVSPKSVGQGELYQFTWYLCKVNEIWKGAREEQPQSFMSRIPHLEHVER